MTISTIKLHLPLVSFAFLSVLSPNFNQGKAQAPSPVGADSQCVKETAEITTAIIQKPLAEAKKLAEPYRALCPLVWLDALKAAAEIRNRSRRSSAIDVAMEDATSGKLTAGNINENSNKYGRLGSNLDDSSVGGGSFLDTVVKIATLGLVLDSASKGNVNPAAAAAVTGGYFQPIPDGSKPSSTGGAMGEEDLPSPTGRSVFFGPASVSGEEGNLYLRECEGKSFASTSRQASQCIAWKGTGEMNYSAVGRPPAAIMSAASKAAPQQSAASTLGQGGFPADANGRACIEVTPQEAKRIPSSPANAALYENGVPYDIAYSYSVANRCTAPVTFLWSFHDRYYRGTTTKSRRIPAGAVERVSCAKVGDQCDGQLSHNARW